MENLSAVYALYTRVLLNSYTGEYETVVTIDRMPTTPGKLRDIARQVNLPSLSPFQPRGRYACTNTSPTVALRTLSFDTLSHGPGPGSQFMSPSELPRLFTLLMQDGYRVDTALTQIMSAPGAQGAGVGSWTDPSVSGTLVCYVTRG